ncbi:ATP-binding protein [Embleya sp. NPDC050493]|uniref:ATP-binding protein n=1 Tax=Embleya sp. NPDC050493 TaxID=3363989 RepID=UPI0037B6E766
MPCLPFSPAGSAAFDTRSPIRLRFGAHVRHAAPLVVLTVGPSPKGVGVARRAVGDLLSGWGASADVCDWAALVVSELVTNVVIHTSSRRIVVAVIESASGELLVAVANRSPARTWWRRHGHVDTDVAESGRGLAIVRAMSARMGSVHRCGHTIVWARQSADRTPENQGCVGPRGPNSPASAAGSN